MHYDTTQAEQGDKVWYGHQGIHAVGNVPNQSQTDDTTQEDSSNIDYAETEHPLFAFQIFYTPFSIITPSQCRTECKCCQSDGQYRAPIYGILLKAALVSAAPLW